MNLSSQITELLKSISQEEFQVTPDKITIEHYKGPNFGHYSSSISFDIARKIGKSPKDIAEIIINKIFEEDKIDLNFEKIENINGFLNFYLSDEHIVSFLTDLLENQKLGTGDTFKNKKIIVEYTDPNPFKQFHMGHFMTNALGESIFRLILSQGAVATNLCYSGDVGIHVAKTIFGLLEKIDNKEYSLEDFLNFSNKKTIEQLGESYVLGSSKYSVEGNKDKIQDLNNMIFTISQKLAIEEGIEIVNKYNYSNLFNFETIEKIYDKGRNESIIYFKSIYSKLGSNFSELYFESVTGEFGSKFVKESPIFEESEGAIIWDGKKHHRNVQVLINSRGNPTYSAKEIGLNILKKIKYNPDISIICTAREQEFYFKDLIEIFKQLGFTQETIHLPHGELRNKNGKMSSRTGDIVTMDDIISQIREEVLINFSSKKDQDFLESISEQIAISSLKYLILKNSTGTNIIYDPKSVSDLTGNTGAYLLYTYARSKSVLKKAGVFSKFSSAALTDLSLHPVEKELLVKALMFNEAVSKAAAEFSPVILATFLYDFSKTFNHFYNEVKIIDSEGDLKDLRLFLTLISKEIIEKGLKLLGINPLENL
jgi:arginyl-tRNA synthetase